MQTGMIENYVGNINDIGPMYPFVGMELLLVIVAVVVWLYWHYKQIQIENEEMKHILKLTKCDKTRLKHISRKNSNNR